MLEHVHMWCVCRGWMCAVCGRFLPSIVLNLLMYISFWYEGLFDRSQKMHHERESNFSLELCRGIFVGIRATFILSHAHIQNCPATTIQPTSFMTSSRVMMRPSYRTIKKQ